LDLGRNWNKERQREEEGNEMKEEEFCHGMVPTLLGELLDLGKRPLSVAMATGISMVRLVALATSPSASLA
jgi:hypothetical protein